ncbi:MAG: response regulator [Bacteroidales bacterium]|nr:response regulator [Bacteroidales bacterium]
MDKLRILIVDDIFTNRLLLSEIIADMGHEYLEAQNGKEAIDLLKENDFDVVLMDIEMPVMNGIETTQYIRANFDANKCNVPIIALTAHNPNLFFDDYKDVGFSQLLTKPYSIERITRLLGTVAVD